MPPTTAQERSRQAASRYLSNIVVIDDKMSMGDSGETHGLNVDELSNAFAQVDFSCGVYKPKGLPDEADIIAKLVRKSDAAVLDWNLTNGQQAGAPGGQQATEQGTALCTSVIQKVLEGDDSSGNPIRLLLIYTAEGINETLVQDLHAALDRDELEVLPTEEFGLTSQNVKIVFKAKPGAGGGAIPFDRTTLSLLDLPGYIIEQYAELASGLMPPAVLHGLAALREKTGDLLGIFSALHDPSIVLHAMLIPETGDAASFLRELMLDEFSRIIDDCDMFGESLSIMAISEWLNRNDSYASHEAPRVQYKANDLVAFLEPRDGNEDLHDKQGKKLLAAFYGGQNWWETAREFCRICTLKYDPWSIERPLGDGFMPVLTLGTIIRNTSGEYLICIVPRCDAARVNDSQSFPFLKTKMSLLDKNFSFTVKSCIDGNIFLAAPKSVSWQKLSLIRFSPQTTAARVKADYHDGSVVRRLKNVRCFKDVDGDLYEWVGELKPHLALKLATDLAPGLSRVGIDEFDWLRLKR